jgi:hypothetical protein
MPMRERREENEGSSATGDRSLVMWLRRPNKRPAGEHEEGSDVLWQMTVNPWQVVASAGQLLRRLFFVTRPLNH